MKKSGTRSRESTGRARKKDSKPTTALISLIRAKNHQTEGSHEKLLADLLQRTVVPTIAAPTITVLESLITTNAVVDTPEKHFNVSRGLDLPTTETCNTSFTVTASNIQSSEIIPTLATAAAASVALVTSGVTYSYFADSPGGDSLGDMTEELARIDREVLLAKKVREDYRSLLHIEIRMIAFIC